jgi:RimJ/RimL family protein N-acetyltransferase
MTITELTTERLRLRGWRDADRDPWAALNADPEVRRYFPNTLTRAESDASIDRYQAQFAAHGWSVWATELRSTGEFIGFIGLWPLPDNIPAAPGVEVGWRLAKAHWGQGYATEGALSARDFGFSVLDLPELVAQTTATNTPSRRVMEKIVLTYDPADDFQHPEADDTHFADSVLYRLDRAGYTRITSANHVPE